MVEKPPQKVENNQKIEIVMPGVQNLNLKENLNISDTLHKSVKASPALKQVINKKYELTELIGSGSYGSVYKGVCRNTGRNVALKIMQDQAKYEYDCIKILREIYLMK